MKSVGGMFGRVPKTSYKSYSIPAIKPDWMRSRNGLMDGPTGYLEASNSKEESLDGFPVNS